MVLGFYFDMSSILFNLLLILYSIFLFGYKFHTSTGKGQPRFQMISQTPETPRSKQILTEADADVLPCFFIKMKLINFVIFACFFQLVHEAIIGKERFESPVTYEINSLISIVGWISTKFAIRNQNIVKKYYKPKLLYYFFTFSLAYEFASWIILQVSIFFDLESNFGDAVYSYYKRYDKSHVNILRNERNIPRKLKLVMEYMETNPSAMKLFGINDESASLVQFNSQQRIYLLEDYNPIAETEIKECPPVRDPSNFSFFSPGKNDSRTLNPIYPEITINSLPKSRIYINLLSDFPERKETNKKFKVISRLNSLNFVKFLDISDIEQLSLDLKEIYNEAEYFVLNMQLPQFKTLSSSPASGSPNQCEKENIQNYLNELVSNPSYIHKVLLDFLNIDDQTERESFLQYNREVLQYKNKFENDKPKKRRRNSKNRSLDMSTFRASGEQLRDDILIKLECSRIYFAPSFKKSNEPLNKILEIEFKVRCRQKVGRNSEKFLKKWKVNKNISDMLIFSDNLKMENQILGDYLKEITESLSNQRPDTNFQDDKKEFNSKIIKSINELFEPLYNLNQASDSIISFFQIDINEVIENKESPNNQNLLTPTKFNSPKKRLSKFKENNDEEIEHKEEKKIKIKRFPF